MTRAELAQKIRSSYPQQATGSDDSIVGDWLQAHPEDAHLLDQESGFSPVATALRVVPSLFAAEGGLPGAALAGGGEALAQTYEKFLSGEPYRPKQMMAQAAIGAIPIGGSATIAKGALKGAGLGAAADVITNIGKGQFPSPKEVAANTVVGGVLGGGVTAALNKFRPPVTTVNRTEDATLQKVRELLTEQAKKTGTPVQAGEAAVPSHIEFAPQPIPTGRPSDRPLMTSAMQKWPEDLRSSVEAILQEHQPEVDQQVRGTMPWDRQRALASHEAISVEKLAPGSITNTETYRAWEGALNTVNERRQTLLQQTERTPAETLALQQLTQQQLLLTLSVRGQKAEAGRLLQSMQDTNRLIGRGGLSFVERMFDVNPELKKSIESNSKLIDQINAAGNDPKEQLKLLRSLVPNTSKFQAYIYNNLLSGLKTQVRVNLAQAFNTAATLLNPAVAAPIDKAVSAFTGKPREVFVGEVPQGLTAIAKALPQAASDALFILRNGFNVQSVERAMEGQFDVPRAEVPGGLLTNFGSRAVGASHIFWRTLGREMERTQGAYAQALKEGLTQPSQIQSRMQTLMTDLEDETAQKVNARAEEAGKRLAFMENPGTLVSYLQQMKQRANAPTRLALTFIIPFIRVSSNVLRQGAESSPLGFAMNAVRQGGREGAQAIGRASLGSMLLAPVAWLAATDRLSGAGPQDPAGRAAAYESGWMPNAVRIGDKWVSYQLFHPLAVPMNVVANAFEQFKNSDQSDATADKLVSQALSASVKSVFDQSFLAGLNGFMSAVNDPEREGQRWMQLAAQDVVPFSGLLRNITQATDPTIRKPEGVTQAVESIIPGLSQTIPPRITRFGEPAQRFGNPVMRGFMAPNVSQVQHDVQADQLAQLKVNPGVPSGHLVYRGKKVPLSQEEQTAVERAVGQMRRIALTRSRRMTDVEAKRELENATTFVHERALALKRQGQPLTVDVLLRGQRRVTKAELDAAYAAYLKGQQ